MVLKTDSSLSRQILEGRLELVFRTIGVLSGFFPIIEVNLEGKFSIGAEGNLRAFAHELATVPLSDGFGVVSLRSNSVVKGCIELARGSTLLDFF